MMFDNVDGFHVDFLLTSVLGGLRGKKVMITKTMKLLIALNYNPAQRLLTLINSSRSSDAYTYQQDKPPLIRIMTCCMFDAKPLAEPVLIYY